MGNNGSLDRSTLRGKTNHGYFTTWDDPPSSLLNVNPGEPSVIPISKRLMAMASNSPNWGSPSKWPFHGL